MCTYKKNGDLFTSETEVRLLNQKFRTKSFDPEVNSYSVNYEVKVADVIGYFNLKIETTDRKLQETYINTGDSYMEFGYYEFFNNVTVSNVEVLIIDALREKPSQLSTLFKNILEKNKDINLT